MRRSLDDTTGVQDPAPERTRRWFHAKPWLGARFGAIWKLLSKNRFRVSPERIPATAVELSASVANSLAETIQNLVWGPRVRRHRLCDDPVFIIGHWRTGTTLLHELLVLDPRHSAPTTYQCFAPGHFLLTERLLTSMLGFLLPDHRAMDNMESGWTRPQEEEFALANLGVGSPYSAIAFPNDVPAVDPHLSLESIGPRELASWKQVYLDFLRRVHFSNGGRLILKSPTNTWRLPVLEELFPSARYIHLVRNPYEIFPSTLHLWKVLYRSYGIETPNFNGLEDRVFRTFSDMHFRLESTRHLAGGRIMDVRYEDLVGNPVKTMRSIYDQLDLGDFRGVEGQIRDRAGNISKYRSNRFEMSASIRERIGEEWNSYFERYSDDAGDPARADAGVGPPVFPPAGSRAESTIR